jgi:hypothetical protein
VGGGVGVGQPWALVLLEMRQPWGLGLGLKEGSCSLL